MAENNQHGERTSALCGHLAHSLGLEPEQCTKIEAASLLHDIGKAAIPQRILDKPGRLTPDERRELETHTTHGHRILSALESEPVELAAIVALTHHERWDGCGYPCGLAGEEIPIEARIVAVCDVFDALTNRRPYRPRPLTVTEATLEMRLERGRAFDPEILDAFLNVVSRRLRVAA